MAVEQREVSAQLAEVEKAINPAKHVIGRNAIVEIECAEQSVSSACLLSHHPAFSPWKHPPSA
jgi:hypothetical protein